MLTWRVLASKFVRRRLSLTVVSLVKCLRCPLDLIAGFEGKYEKLGKHEDTATAVEFSQETGQIISSGMDKSLMLWDIRGPCRANKCIKTDADVASISLCHHYLVAAIKECVHVYDLRNMSVAHQSLGSSMDFQICCVRSFSDEKGYVAGSIDGRVVLKVLEGSQSSETGSVFLCHPKSKERRHHLVGVNDIAAHSCQNTFITGDNEGYSIVWDAENKKRKFEFPKQSNSVASVSYNYSGGKLAMAISYTYSEVEEEQQCPEIFLYDVDELGRPFLNF